MRIQVSPEFEPSELLGHSGNGLVGCDESGKVLLLNRAATTLGIDPVLAMSESETALQLNRTLSNWVAKSKNGTRETDTFLDMVVDVRCLFESPGLNILSLRGASDRLQIAKDSEEYEHSQVAGFESWNTRIQSVALLRLLRQYADDPVDRRGLFEIARLTGSGLFPKGGALAFPEDDGVLWVTESWGDPLCENQFPESSCLSRSGSNDQSCRHFLSGQDGTCRKVANGVLSLRHDPTSQDERLIDLFCKTINEALTALS